MEVDLDSGNGFDRLVVHVRGLVAPCAERSRNRGQKCNRAEERLDAGDAALLVDPGLYRDRTGERCAGCLRVHVSGKLTDFHFFVTAPKS